MGALGILDDRTELEGRIFSRVHASISGALDSGSKASPRSRCK